METNNAVAAEFETPGPENGLATVETKLAVRPDWSPDTLRQEVEREGQMRVILREYMSKAMIKDHHYYSFKEGDKPALTQEGAHSICSLMKTVIGAPEIEKIFDGDHLTISARVHIYNQAGEQVASGDGMCSTKESKYAYRWAWDNEVVGVDVSKLKSQSGPKKNGGTWTKYQMPNQDLPDLYNTVLKMGVKRAKVSAVRQLPLVSELFAPEGADERPEVDDRKQGGRRGGSQQGSGPAAGGAPAAARTPDKTSIETVVMLAKKLEERGIPHEDLVTQFLPEGVADFDKLTAEQADEIRPSMVEVLNAKLKP